MRRRRRFEAPLDDAVLDAAQSDDELPAATTATEHDDILRLIFTCCHPALTIEAQVALTLRTLCGLTTDEIARAFLTPPATMAQRLVRAKNKIKIAKIPYAVPGREELDERLDAVLTVVYLVFSEGYAATAGDLLVRRDLTREAIRLGRLIEQLLPQRSEPIALVALMLLHDARRDARTDSAGDIVLLEDQDRTRWDREQIAEGARVSSERSEWDRHRRTRSRLRSPRCTRRRRAPMRRTGARSYCSYDELRKRLDTPVIALNHAAAVAMVRRPRVRPRATRAARARGRDAGLSPLLRGARRPLRRKALPREALVDYERALTLAKNQPEQRYLLRRILELRATIP